MFSAAGWNGFAGCIWHASRSLESPGLDSSTLHLWNCNPNWKIILLQTQSYFQDCWTFDSFKRDVDYYFKHRDNRLNSIDYGLNDINNKISIARSLMSTSTVHRQDANIHNQRKANSDMYALLTALQNENKALEKFKNELQGLINTQKQINIDQDKKMTIAKGISDEQENRLKSAKYANYHLDYFYLGPLYTRNYDQEHDMEKSEETNSKQYQSMAAFPPKNKLQHTGISNIEAENTHQDKDIEEAKSDNTKQNSKLISIASANADQDRKLTAVENGIESLKSTVRITIERIISEIKEKSSKILEVPDPLMVLLRRAAGI